MAEHQNILRWRVRLVVPVHFLTVGFPAFGAGGRPLDEGIRKPVRSGDARPAAP